MCPFEWLNIIEWFVRQVFQLDQIFYAGLNNVVATHLLAQGPFLIEIPSEIATKILICIVVSVQHSILQDWLKSWPHIKMCITFCHFISKLILWRFAHFVILKYLDAEWSVRKRIFRLGQLRVEKMFHVITRFFHPLLQARLRENWLQLVWTLWAQDLLKFSEPSWQWASIDFVGSIFQSYTYVKRRKFLTALQVWTDGVKTLPVKV